MCGIQGKMDGKLASLIGATGQFQLSPVCLNNIAGDGQSQTKALREAAHLLAAVKRFEYLCLFRQVDARTGITHLEPGF